MLVLFRTSDGCDFSLTKFVGTFPVTQLRRKEGSIDESFDMATVGQSEEIKKEHESAYPDRRI